MSLLRQGFKGLWLLPLSWIACLRVVSCHVERPAWQETKAPPKELLGAILELSPPGLAKPVDDCSLAEN